MKPKLAAKLECSPWKKEISVKIKSVGEKGAVLRLGGSSVDEDAVARALRERCF